MTGLERGNLALRGLMELGVVCGFAYWGYQTGGPLLAVVAPVIGFGFWGGMDFRQAGTAREPLRLVQELVISGAAAVGLYTAGQPALGWGLAIVSVVHHALVYTTGHRLLKRE